MKYLVIVSFAIAAVLCGVLLKSERDRLVRELDAAHAQVEQLQADAESTRHGLEARDEIDKRRFQELSDAKNEIDKLRSDVLSGSKRLLVKASCPKLPAAAGASGVDDAGNAELTADARQDYLRLREQIAVKEKQLDGLQEYVRVVVLKGEH